MTFPNIFAGQAGPIPLSQLDANFAVAANNGANSDITSLSALTSVTALQSINGGQLAGLRNRIINGGFGVWQRGTSISCPAATSTYTADRWLVAPTGNASTVTRGGKIGGSFYTLFATGATGITNISFSQRIESFNSFDLANASVTVSGFIFQSTGSAITTATVRLFNPNSQDDYLGVTQTGATITLPSIPNATWTQFKCQIAVGTNAINGIAVYIDTNAAIGPGASLGIGAIQLEFGSTATTLEQRPIGMELGLCQRYFQQIVPADGWYRYFPSAGSYALTTFTIPTMRTAPTVTIPSYSVTGVAISPVLSAVAGSVKITMTASGAGEGGLTTNVIIQASAEL